MNAPRSVLIALGAVLILGVVAVAALRGVAPEGDAVATPAAPTSAPTASADPPALAPAPAAAATDDAPPPWATGVDVADPSTAAAEATAAPDAQRQRQMAELQDSMSAVLDDALERSASTAVHLRKALDTLEAMDDPAVKAKINLEALRHNLEISVRMADVSRRMKAELDQPPSDARDGRIATLREEFARLQAQLRQDVAVDGSGAVAPTTVPSQGAAPPPPTPAGSPGP